MSKPATDREIGHLLRRAGFGPSSEEIADYRALGFEGAVDRLVSGLSAAPPADPAGLNVYLPGAISAAWLERMRSSATPLAEKLTLFWHGNFATSIRKVDDPKLMWAQMKIFRSLG